MKFVIFYLCGIVSLDVAQAQVRAERSIYQCVGAAGEIMTSDHPLPGCHGPQTARSSNGRIVDVPASLSPLEQSVNEERQRKAAEVAAARRTVARHDQNLVAKYPDEATHRKAREAELTAVRAYMHTSEMRLVAIDLERKPLTDEAEFYKGKDLPLKLKLALDSNDAARDAQKALLFNKRAEIADIDARFDAELAHLRLLWAVAAARAE
jgi:hypothetical protein